MFYVKAVLFFFGCWCAMYLILLLVALSFTATLLVASIVACLATGYLLEDLRQPLWSR